MKLLENVLHHQDYSRLPGPGLSLFLCLPHLRPHAQRASSFDSGKAGKMQSGACECLIECAIGLCGLSVPKDDI